MNTQLTIVDGSQGEGGGQIFRSSLTLAMCLNKPVVIKNIRAGRSKPGLLRQHLACLNAAADISEASVSGNTLGSTEVTFKPGKVTAGRYCFAVGTAGSTTLIFQTILLPLLFSGSKSDITFEGGTHNGMAPTFDFISKSFLSVLRKMGAKVDTELVEYGFFPAGGGRWRATIYPLDSLQTLSLTERDELLNEDAIVVSSQLPKHVGKRELEQIESKLNWPSERLTHHSVRSVGPGNVVSLIHSTKRSTMLFEAFGQRGLSATAVADQAIEQLLAFKQSDACVCEHLADQLILPLALGQGGEFTTTRPSLHLLTNIEVVKQMTNTQVDVIEKNNNTWSIRVFPKLS